MRRQNVKQGITLRSTWAWLTDIHKHWEYLLEMQILELPYPETGSRLGMGPRDLHFNEHSGAPWGKEWIRNTRWKALDLTGRGKETFRPWPNPQPLGALSPTKQSTVSAFLTGKTEDRNQPMEPLTLFFNSCDSLYLLRFQRFLPPPVWINSF